MVNATHEVSFVLAMYGDTGQFRYLYFTVALLFYTFVIVANSGLIIVIYMNKTLHEPMYLLLCCLFVNEIYGSTAMLPCFMVHILSQTHEIAAHFCFIQIYNMHSYAAVEFGTLTVMAYDRYVCICKPLHYNAIMTKRKVQVSILSIWIICLIEVGILLSFTIRLKFCGTVINKVFCANHLVVRLSCTPSEIVSIVHDLVFGLILSVVGPVGYISYSYANILSVCLKGTKETRHKALETCTPHFVSLTSFVFACFYSLITQRFDTSSVPYPLCVFLSVYVFIIVPLQNPLIYGLKLSKIRNVFKQLFTLKFLHHYIFHSLYFLKKMCSRW